MPDLSPCVRQILCALSQPLRNALTAQLTLARSELQAQLVILQAKVAQYEVLAVGARIVAAVAQAALAQVQAAANLLPLSLISNCTDLGDVNVSVRQNIDRVSQDLVVATQKLTRVLSVSDELADAINVINEQISLLNAVLDAAGAC